MSTNTDPPYPLLGTSHKSMLVLEASSKSWVTHSHFGQDCFLEVVQPTRRQDAILHNIIRAMTFGPD